MIVQPRDADRFAAAPPKTLRVVLVFGPDAGLVRERAEKLMKSVVPDLRDAFNVADLSEAVLEADPARLADEAAAISMMGGRRVVRVRDAGNDLTELFEGFLKDPPGDALVVVEAGDLSKGASLRKLFEEDDVAAAIACYADTARNLEEVVRESLPWPTPPHGWVRIAACRGGNWKSWRFIARARKASALTMFAP